MGEKKSKALALELIDDLLDEGANKSGGEDKADKPVEEQKNDGTNPIVVELGSSRVTEAPPHGEDRTERIKDSTAPINPQTSTVQTTPTSQAELDDRVRASVGRYGALRSGGPASVSEAALAQSESLRIAQARLLEFEQEIERLRLQNEELAAAGETLRRRTDELLAENQRRENDYQHALSTFQQEKEILTGNKEALQRELSVLRQKNEELELRISTNIQKIRVRERELENRLELVKMESAALIRSKDEMILELKRQIDQLNLELNNYRTKNQELNRLTTDKQEQLRRTVKALRLALSMLEGEEEAPKNSQRKAK
jgi:chromosome segregation ATPase